MKTAAKGAGGLGGAGVGAAIGAFLGPAGAVVGDAIGGVAAWVAADAVIIRVDEFFNREKFVAEVRALVDEEKARLQAAIAADISRKAGAVAGRTIQETRAAREQDQ